MHSSWLLGLQFQVPLHLLQPESGTVCADQQHVVVDAVNEAAELEELQSVKNEQLATQMLETAAEHLTLFAVELVAARVVEIDSSSGSDSSSSSYDSDSCSTEQLTRNQAVRYTESVPQGLDYCRHVKGGIVHRCESETKVSMCKLSMGRNFRMLDREFHISHPSACAAS